MCPKPHKSDGCILMSLVFRTVEVLPNESCNGMLLNCDSSDLFLTLLSIPASSLYPVWCVGEIESQRAQNNIEMSFQAY